MSKDVGTRKYKTGLKSDKATDIASDEFLYSIWNFFELNLSQATRKNYFNVVKSYIEIVGHDPLRLTQEDVYKYNDYLQTKVKKKRLSYQTAQMRISVMRTLCEYIRLREAAKGNEYINYFKEIILPDVDKRITAEQLPDIDEINNLFSIIREHNDDTAFVLFSLIVKCGLSAGEAVSIKHDYLLLDTDECFCINFPPKKNTKRIIKLPEDINKILVKYLSSNLSGNEYIFLNKRGTNLKIRDAERILKKYIEIGIERNLIVKHFTMQTLRHLSFKYMLMGQATESDVAKYAGITTKWMSRYRMLSNESIKLDTADKSIVSIKFK